MASKREKEKKARKRADAHKWAKQKEQSGDFSCIKLPDTCEFAKIPKEDKAVIKWDFMMWVAGKFNPDNEDGDEGFEVYKRVYGQHRIPAPGSEKVVACRRRCWNKPCAVCEYMMRNAGTMGTDLAKSMKEKRRIIWLVNDKPGKTPNGKDHKWKVFDSNLENKGIGFGELMKDAIDMLGEDDYPFDPATGKTARMKVKEQAAFAEGGSKWYCVTRIDWEDRKGKYPSSIVEDAPCLDECIVDPGYKEIMQLLTSGMNGEEGDGEEDEDRDEPSRNGKTSKGKAKSDDTEDEEDDNSEDEPDVDEEATFKVGDKVEHDDYGECVVDEVSEDGSSLTLKQGRKKHKGVDPDDCSLVEEEEPVAKTAKKVATKKATAKEDEDESEDSDLDSEEEDSDLDDSSEEPDEEPPTKKGKGKGKK